MQAVTYANVRLVALSNTEYNSQTIELGNRNNTVAKNTFIDFHADNAADDYDSRIIRWGTTNDNRMDVLNAGGDLLLQSISGNVNISGTQVGIDTDNPGAKLDIIATGDEAPILRLGTERSWIFEQAGSGAAAALSLRPQAGSKDFYIRSQDKSQTALTVRPRNAVGTSEIGINTTNPAATLHVEGNARVTSLPTGVSSDQIVVANNNGDLRKRTVADIDTNIYDSNGILTGNRVIYTANNNLVVDNNTLHISGNSDRVGINTGSPAATFHVNGSVRLEGLGGGNSANDVVTRETDGDLETSSFEDVTRYGTRAGFVTINDVVTNSSSLEYYVSERQQSSCTITLVDTGNQNQNDLRLFISLTPF